MVLLSKDEVGIYVDDNNKKIKLKIYFNERTYESSKIPDKLNKVGYKKFEYGKQLFEYLKSGGYFWIDYQESDDYVDLHIDDFNLSDTKKINVCITLGEFIDSDDFLNEINDAGPDELKKIIIKQHAHIKFLNNKLSKLTKHVETLDDKYKYDESEDYYPSDYRY
jgi:hypothetical protein